MARRMTKGAVPSKIVTQDDKEFLTDDEVTRVIEALLDSGPKSTEQIVTVMNWAHSAKVGGELFRLVQEGMVTLSLNERDEVLLSKRDVPWGRLVEDREHGFDHDCDAEGCEQ